MWKIVKRFWNWLRALGNRGMDHLEDPDMMLDQAKRDMQESLVGNRELAVQAITQKNRLEQMLEDKKELAEQIEKKAEIALRSGNRDLARALMREGIANTATIETLQVSYDNAEKAVESAKLAIKRQEEEYRKKAAEVLALKAQYKQAQIQISINKSLSGLTFDEMSDSIFSEARERVKSMQAEAGARQEMLGESLQGKVMELEDKSMVIDADEELRTLEERLG